MHRLPLLILALLLLPPSISRAEELHVPGEHATIKAAIKAAEDGDHILVAPGTYIERLNSKGKAITIQGEQGAEATIIDATGQGRDSAMTCNSSETSSTRLINLTFTGGLGQMNMTRGEIMGGGALVVDASPPSSSASSETTSPAMAAVAASPSPAALPASSTAGSHGTRPNTSPEDCLPRSATPCSFTASSTATAAHAVAAPTSGTTVSRPSNPARSHTTKRPSSAAESSTGSRPHC